MYGSPVRPVGTYGRAGRDLQLSCFKIYGRPGITYIYNKIPIAMGNLHSVVCVSACKGWFGDTLDQSRLDKYYRMITVLAWINLCWFFLVTTFYSTKEEEEEACVELQEIKVEVIFVDAS